MHCCQHRCVAAEKAALKVQSQLRMGSAYLTAEGRWLLCGLWLSRPAFVWSGHVGYNALRSNGMFHACLLFALDTLAGSRKWDNTKKHHGSYCGRGLQGIRHSMVYFAIVHATTVLQPFE